MAKRKLKGEVLEFGVGKKKRPYIVVTVPFAEARSYFRPKVYAARTGEGEQREIVPAHANKLRKEMEDGKFTPTAWSAGLRAHHKKALKIEKGVAILDVDPGDPLPLNDGGHRRDALEQLWERANDAIRAATTDKERQRAEEELTTVENQPITVMVMLDGNLRTDFVNLQKSRPADRSHMLSMQASEADADEDLKVAVQVAKLLNENPSSPFHRLIRFDTCSYVGYPLSTFCGRGGSDLATSLLGLAKVGRSKSPEWMAQAVVSAFQALQEKAPDLLESGQVLTPPPYGKKGAMAMLVGVGLALAYRMIVCGEEEASPRSRDALADAASDVLNVPAAGNLSGPSKRKLIGVFVEVLFSDLPEVEKHGQVPLDLVKNILSPSAFACEPLPKPKRKKSSRPESVGKMNDHGMSRRAKRAS